MNKLHRPTVALIFGGRGYEREVSVLGAENLFSLIPEEKYERIPIFIDAAGRFLMPEADATPAEMASGKAQMRECYPAYISGRGGLSFDSGFIPIDAAFPLLHGDFGEDGVVQGALECARIAYVGCDVVGSAVARDKMLVKAIAESLGIPTARGVLCPRGEVSSAIRESERLFGYPVFVKPTRLGSSIGAGAARNRRELYSELGKALSLGTRAVIEEYVDIEKELECAYFAVKGKELFTNLGEIRADGFYDYEKKYGKASLRREVPSGHEAEGERDCSCLYSFAGSSTAIAEPSLGGSLSASVSEFAAVSADVERLAREYARRLVRALSLRDLSRIDFFLAKDGRLYFNEINTMPGCTETSLYMRLVARCGITPVALVCSLIDGAITRGA